MQKTIGVLALQGDFEAHAKALRLVGAEVREVRTPAELGRVAALAMPGGESTTMLKLLHEEGMFEPLKEFGQKNPILATCAGAILLATEVKNPVQESLGLVDMTIERNAYGRQVDSRIVRLATPFGESEAVFIRAPIIRRTGKDSEVLATYLDTPVLVRSGHHVVATFHPELSDDGKLHRYFVHKIAQTGTIEEVKRTA